MKHSSIRVVLLSIGLLALVLGLPASAQDEPIDITMIIYTEASNLFWIPAIQGAQDAAQMHNVKIDIQYGDADPVKQNDIIEAAIANQVDGIAVGIYDDDAFDDTICAAREAGIAVVSFNVDDSQGADGNCRMAYIGQDFIAAGMAIGRRMIADHGISEGDLIFTPVEYPEAIYATKRHEGVQRALDEVGAVSEMVGTGINPPDVLSIMVQYLIGHPDTVAIIGLGGTPTLTAPQAIQEAGVDIPIGGFDLQPEIIDGIADGVITATVDQQPYSQGFYSVTQLALYVKYGLYPSDINTGGAGLVDPSNVELVRALTGTIR